MQKNRGCTIYHEHPLFYFCLCCSITIMNKDCTKIVSGILKLIKVAVLIILVSSCKTVFNLNLQVLTPAQVSIPSEINKVVVVNHSNYRKSIFYDSANRPLKNTDSLYSNEYLAGLNDIFENSPRYEIANSNAIYILKDSYSQRFQPLSWDEVGALCEKYKADAVIALENYTIPQNPVILTKYLPGYGLYYGRITVENSSLWKIYSLSEKKIVDDYTLKDTMSWDAYEGTTEDLEQSLPDKDEIIYQSCYQAGTKYGKRIGQTWQRVERILYNYPNEDFQKAITLANNNNWLDAIEIWKKYPYSNKRKLAALASFNLAVACEALDDLDAALDWAAKSYLMKPDDITQKYIDILEMRKRQQKTIEKQTE